jgi:hypothetical protein
VKPFAREDRSEIEAETVDVHFLHPVAQAVGHHLDHARMAQVERVPRAGVVDVVALLLRNQSIVRRVVDAFVTERRTAFVAFGGVVVDDVEDDLESRVVKTRDHLFELLHAAQRIGEVARIRGEERDRVVAPVVRQPLVEQMAVVEEHVDRQ